MRIVIDEHDFTMIALRHLKELGYDFDSKAVEIEVKGTRKRKDGTKKTGTIIITTVEGNSTSCECPSTCQGKDAPEEPSNTPEWVDVKEMSEEEEVTLFKVLENQQEFEEREAQESEDEEDFSLFKRNV